MNLKSLLIMTCLILLWFVGAHADTTQPQATEKQEKRPPQASEVSDVVVHIGEIVVKETQVPARIDLPGSVDVLGYEQIKYENVDNAMDLLWKIPGISVGDYGSGGYPNAFTLRGHDLMGHSNHTVITVDGIPVNTHLENADGGSDLNQIAPDEIHRLEVVKGPIDARYGNWNRAGVIHYHSKNRGDFAKVNTQIGSWDTQKVYATVGKEHLNNRFNHIYSIESYGTDGWRDNSARERKNVYGRWFYRPVDALQIGLTTQLYTSTWDSGGYISEAQWQENPRQAATDNWDGGYKDTNQGALHLDWRLSPGILLETKLWMMDNSFARYTSSTTTLQQGVAFRDNKTYGALMNMSWESSITGGNILRLDGGADYRRFDDHIESWNTTANRVKIDRRAPDADYLFDNYGAYLKANLDLSHYLRIFGGVRQDWFTGDKTADDDPVTKKMKDYDVFSWKTGLIISPLHWFSVYGNVATTFQLPNGTSKYDDNPADPRDFMFWETGFTLHPVDWLLFRYAYSQQEEERYTRDQETQEWVFEGDAQRNVHEASLNLKPFRDLDLFAAYTYQDTEYTGGVNANNTLAYIPKSIWKAGIGYTLPWQTTRCQVWYNNVGKYYTNVANTFTYGGYETIDAKIIHYLNEQWTIVLDGRNLADKKYAGFVYAGTAGNVYAVSNPRAVYLSVKYEY